MNQDKKTVPVITIDGPSGTGKGTLCHLLAKELGWHFLDSGAIYRVLAYAAQKHNVDDMAVDALVMLAQRLDLYFETNTDEQTLVFLDGEEISHAIRTEACGQQASKIAANPCIRAALLKRQRDFAIPPGLVTDGRDMGTVVFPDAILKIYLHASPEERALRRYLQLKEKGNHDSLASVVDELAQRDARDTARTHAPLKPAEDGVQVDTTGLTIVQVLGHVLQLLSSRFSMGGV